MIENFDRLSDAEKTLIHALPYRVGLWMSMLEPQGGDQADEAEIAAMVDHLRGVAKSNHDEFAAYICRQTLARQSEWAAWSNDFSQVPSECRQAMRILGKLIPSEDIRSLQQALFGVALAVAHAYRETRGEYMNEQNAADINPILSDLELQDHANAQGISPLESRALAELAHHLGVTGVADQSGIV